MNTLSYKPRWRNAFANATPRWRNATSSFFYTDETNTQWDSIDSYRQASMDVSSGYYSYLYDTPAYEASQLRIRAVYDEEARNATSLAVATYLAEQAAQTAAQNAAAQASLINNQLTESNQFAAAKAAAEEQRIAAERAAADSALAVQQASLDYIAQQEAAKRAYAAQATAEQKAVADKILLDAQQQLWIAEQIANADRIKAEQAAALVVQAGLAEVAKAEAFRLQGIAQAAAQNALEAQAVANTTAIYGTEAAAAQAAIVAKDAAIKAEEAKVVAAQGNVDAQKAEETVINAVVSDKLSDAKAIDAGMQPIYIAGGLALAGIIALIARK